MASAFGSLPRNITVKPPKGWTTDKKEMGYDYFWANKDSRGQRIVRKHGLKPAQPIMCCTRDSGDCLHMFRSGDKYYIWNPIEGGIWEIVTSMGLVDIVTEIDKPRHGSLKTEKVYQMYSGDFGLKDTVDKLQQW